MSNYKHLQGFANLKKPMRFTSIKKDLSSRVHLEKAHGTDHRNQKYCSKKKNFFGHGEPITQGQRSDLIQLTEEILDGENNITNVAKKYGPSFIRYHRGIKEFIKLTNPITPRSFKTKVNYYNSMDHRDPVKAEEHKQKQPPLTRIQYTTNQEVYGGTDITSKSALL